MLDRQFKVPKILLEGQFVNQETITSTEFEDFRVTQKEDNFLNFNELVIDSLLYIDTNEIQTNVEIKLLNLPNLTKNPKFLQQLSLQNGENPLFENDAIEQILQSKWDLYGYTHFK